MSHDPTPSPPPLDLSGWRKLPTVLMVVGGLLSVLGAAVNPKEFGFSWLLAFMFYYSLALGALLGLVGAVGMACWVESRDHSFRTPEDIEQRLGVEVLGSIPRVARPQAAGNGAPAKGTGAKAR